MSTENNLEKAPIAIKLMRLKGSNKIISDVIDKYHKLHKGEYLFDIILNNLDYILIEIIEKQVEQINEIKRNIKENN